MLTDRQEKFYNRIVSLSQTNAKVTKEERAYLKEASKMLYQEWEFKWVINNLNIGLKKLSNEAITKVQLSPEVKILYRDLVEIYGPPDSEMSLPLDSKRPKDWSDSNPDFVYTGSGGVSGWSRRGPVLTGKAWWKFYINGILQMLVFCLFMLFMLAMMSTSLYAWFVNKIGKTSTEIMVIMIIVAFMVWIVISGNLRRKRKRPKKDI